MILAPVRASSLTSRRTFSPLTVLKAPPANTLPSGASSRALTTPMIEALKVGVDRPRRRVEREDVVLGDHGSAAGRLDLGELARRDDAVADRQDRVHHAVEDVGGPVRRVGRHHDGVGAVLDRAGRQGHAERRDQGNDQQCRESGVAAASSSGVVPSSRDGAGVLGSADRREVPRPRGGGRRLGTVGAAWRMPSPARSPDRSSRYPVSGAPPTADGPHLRTSLEGRDERTGYALCRRAPAASVLRRCGICTAGGRPSTRRHPPTRPRPAHRRRPRPFGGGTASDGSLGGRRARRMMPGQAKPPETPCDPENRSFPRATRGSTSATTWPSSGDRSSSSP